MYMGTASSWDKKQEKVSWLFHLFFRCNTLDYISLLKIWIEPTVCFDF